MWAWAKVVQGSLTMPSSVTYAALTGNNCSPTLQHGLQHETQHRNGGLQSVRAMYGQVLRTADRQYRCQLCQGCESGAGAAAPGTGAGDARTRPSLGRKRGMPFTTGYATAHSSQTSSDAIGSHLRSVRR